MSAETRGLLTLSDDSSAGTSVVSLPASRWKTRVFIPAALFGCVVVLLGITSARAFLPSTPVRVVPVVIRAVEGATGSVTVQAPGWLEPDPHLYYAPALAEGVVETMLVLEGDVVEAGDVVARLIDDDARIALDRADADVLQRQAELAAAEADVEAAAVRMDSLVERVLAVESALAGVKESEAELERVAADVAVEDAKRLELSDEYERKAKLVDSRAVSEAVVARLALRVRAQEAMVDATTARRGVVEARLRQARADLQAAERNRELLIEERRAVALARARQQAAAARLALANADRADAALRRDRMAVRAPVDGVVLQRFASPGTLLGRDRVDHGMHVVSLYQPRHLQVRVDVPLADAAHVHIGQAAEVTIEVQPDRVFTGHVTRVVHQADIQKNTVEVKVGLDDPDATLKPEMLARVRFIGNARPEGGASAPTRQRVFAPGALVQTGPDGRAAVLVVSDMVDSKGRVVERSIVLGSRRIDGWVEVDEGLHVGDLLIAEPVTGLAAGKRVRVIGEAMLNGGTG